MTRWEEHRDRRDAGATATEYGFLVAFIALALIAGITFFGDSLNTWFANLASNLGTLL